MANQTILHFHTGRGGRFHNEGHVTYCGTSDIVEVLQNLDCGKHNSFINYENEIEIFKTLEKRDLRNLIKLFEKCRDKSDFTEFTAKTGLELGDQWYFNSNGDKIISVEEAEQGLGRLNWDGSYDTDVCMLLSDCSESDLKIILRSEQYDKHELIQQYFDENTKIKIDWAKFDSDRYADLINDYFNFNGIDAEDFYTEEEEA